MFRSPGAALLAASLAACATVQGPERSGAPLAAAPHAIWLGSDHRPRAVASWKAEKRTATQKSSAPSRDLSGSYPSTALMASAIEHAPSWLSIAARNRGDPKAGWRNMRSFTKPVSAPRRTGNPSTSRLASNSCRGTANWASCSASTCSRSIEPSSNRGLRASSFSTFDFIGTDRPLRPYAGW